MYHKIRNTLHETRNPGAETRDTVPKTKLYEFLRTNLSANYAKQTQLLKSQINVNPYNTSDYENKSNWTLGENKPNSNPIKPNFKILSPKQREEKKASGKLPKKQFYFFIVAKRPKQALYSENTDT